MKSHTGPFSTLVYYSSDGDGGDDNGDDNHEYHDTKVDIHLSDMFLWPLAQKNALGPSSSLGSKLQN